MSLERPALLLVSPDPWRASAYSSEQYELITAAGVRDGLSHLRERRVHVIVTGLELADGSGLDFCSKSDHGAPPPPVVVTVPDVTDGPRALKAGAATVLLQPFTPNLLFARVGRLLRLSDELQARTRGVMRKADLASSKLAHLHERSRELHAGLNRAWPNSSCPKCGGRDVVNFEHAQRQQDWYGCLTCETVWLAPELPPGR